MNIEHMLNSATEIMDILNNCNAISVRYGKRDTCQCQIHYFLYV